MKTKWGSSIAIIYYLRLLECKWQVKKVESVKHHTSPMLQIANTLPLAKILHKMLSRLLYTTGRVFAGSRSTWTCREWPCQPKPRITWTCFPWNFCPPLLGRNLCGRATCCFADLRKYSHRGLKAEKKMPTKIEVTVVSRCSLLLVSRIFCKNFQMHRSNHTLPETNSHSTFWKWTNLAP